jgi:hypothetical protein
VTASEVNRSNRPITRRNLAGLTPREARAIAITTARIIRSGRGRFELYEYLSTIYRTYRSWKRRKIARKTARLMARELEIAWRKDISPIRILIEATLPSADPKQKSRWVRALQYASLEAAPTTSLKEFFRARRGIAGCARLAAKRKPRQNRTRNDWAD